MAAGQADREARATLGAADATWAGETGLRKRYNHSDKPACLLLRHATAPRAPVLFVGVVPPFARPPPAAGTGLWAVWNFERDRLPEAGDADLVAGFLICEEQPRHPSMRDIRRLSRVSIEEGGDKDFSDSDVGAAGSITERCNGCARKRVESGGAPDRRERLRTEAEGRGAVQLRGHLW